MANQSIVAVPPDVSDPRVLRRFLARMVEDVDIILGNRANSEYVIKEELLEEAAKLTLELEEAKATLEAVILELNESIQNNEDVLIKLVERVFTFVSTTSSVATSAQQVIGCYNNVDINVTLSTTAKKGDEVHIKRRGLGGVNVLGLIDGLTNKYINVPYYSMHLFFTGTEWIEI